MNKKEKSKQLEMFQIIYEQLVENIDVGIQVVDSERKTIIYNKKKMQIESMYSKEVLNKNSRRVYL